MRPNRQFPADMSTFTEKILNKKPHFMCSLTLKLLALEGVRNSIRSDSKNFQKRSKINLLLAQTGLL